MVLSYICTSLNEMICVHDDQYIYVHAVSELMYINADFGNLSTKSILHLPKIV